MVRSAAPSGGIALPPTVTSSACGRPVRIVGLRAPAGRVKLSPFFSSPSFSRSPASSTMRIHTSSLAVNTTGPVTGAAIGACTPALGAAAGFSACCSAISSPVGGVSNWVRQMVKPAITMMPITAAVQARVRDGTRAGSAGSNAS